MQIGVPRETVAGETRVAATPDTIKKYLANQHTVVVERGAGLSAHFPDHAYESAGATLVDAQAALAADIVLKVQKPTSDEQSHLKANSLLIGMLDPLDSDGVAGVARTGVAGFALERAPGMARAQSLHVLSPHGHWGGYKAVCLGAQHYGRIFPMMMTAAGTLKAVRVVLLGAGVGGW